ncbi:hypothetical protein LTR17_022302 [Elasticomyces elasticus]|nr:hypothetical protein LTR17_022302 [Elasticomyces elasticus]
MTMPAEALVEIANSVEPRCKADLIALRTTCRELEAASQDAFARAYFTNRKHLFTRRTGAWANWQDKAAFLDDEAQITALIHQAFLALASLGTTTDIALTYSDSGVGMKQLLAAIGHKTSSSDLDRGDINYASKCILTAVVCSGLRSHKFMIGEYAELYSSSLHASAFQISGALMPGLHTWLAQLHTLELHCDTRLPIGDEEERTFVAMARACANLSTLHLQWNGWFVEPIVSGRDVLLVMDNAFKYCSLRRITLNNMSAHATSYIAFLHTHRHTLTTHKTGHPFVPRRQFWSAVLEWLLKHAGLETLHICDLARSGNGGVVGDDSGGETSSYFEGGVKEVKQNLRGLIPCITYWKES